jgi:hypothetical protein
MGKMKCENCIHILRASDNLKLYSKEKYSNTVKKHIPKTCKWLWYG